MCSSDLADLLIYGMGEKPIKELVRRLKSGIPFNEIKDIRQTVYLADKEDAKDDDIVLFSHEECLKDKLKQAKNFRHIEEESNKYNASRILQKVGKQVIVVNPPFPPMTEAEMCIRDSHGTRRRHGRRDHLRRPAKGICPASIFFLLEQRPVRDRKSTRLNSSHITRTRMPSSA